MRYFPDPVSGWLFLSALLGLLAAATYTDQRTMKVPKWLTVPGFALGLFASCLRGGWLAAHGGAVWLLGEGSGAALGALDGLLFGLVGALVGFGLFFLLWAMGVCGGGDVKLFAAVGAWVGAYLVFCVLVVTLLLLWLYLFVAFAARLARGLRRAGRKPGGGSSRLIVRYALVVAVATAPVVLWAFRADLGLVPPSQPAGSSAEVRADAR